VPVLWISLGAVVGANARYLVGIWVAERFGAAFPYGTLMINVGGSLLLGLFLGLLTERATADPAWRLSLAVGFCGSYTTFSTYSFETIALLRQGALAAAATYAIASVALSLLATAAGLAAARLV
jgi:CrcB protein